MGQILAAKDHHGSLLSAKLFKSTSVSQGSFEPSNFRCEALRSCCNSARLARLLNSFQLDFVSFFTPLITSIKRIKTRMKTYYEKSHPSISFSPSKVSLSSLFQPSCDGARAAVGQRVASTLSFVTCPVARPSTTYGYIWSFTLTWKPIDFCS